MQAHYKRVAPRLLQACEVYLTGTTPVGSFLSSEAGSAVSTVPRTPVPPTGCPPCPALGPPTPSAVSAMGEEGASVVPAVSSMRETAREEAEEPHGGTSPQPGDGGEGTGPNPSALPAQLVGTGSPATLVTAVPSAREARSAGEADVEAARPAVEQALPSRGEAGEGVGAGSFNHDVEVLDGAVPAGGPVPAEGPDGAEGGGGVAAGVSGAPSEGFRLSLRRLMPRIKSALAAL